MLIRKAELQDLRIADVRLKSGRIAAIGTLQAEPGERVVDAKGALLLPGLHDHHLHLAALAASLTSVRCGPPDVNDPSELAAAVRQAGEGWLRGIGYHESVAGLLNMESLDAMNADRPIRIQHRSGRMWFFNSAGLDRILTAAPAPSGLDRQTGRLFDEDEWLRTALASEPPSFAAVGSSLARLGVTGVTDMSVGNDPDTARHFGAERQNGALPQRVLLAGKLDLSNVQPDGGIIIGPAKIHLHEARLPSFEETIRFVEDAHALGRPVAIHCVTEVELVYALAAVAEAGPMRGDRIEHASIAPDTAVAEISRLGLAVVTQPNFIAERGDIYLRDVDRERQPILYRLQAFLKAGVPLAAGSDAPFGRPDPWTAMAAAVSRTTGGGSQIGPDESLTPEEALDLYLRNPERLEERRTIRVGAAADLCLLDRPWAKAREDLGSVTVRATIVDQRIVFNRVDEAPL